MPFHRFPHTPHLAWLGSDRPRRDKVLSAEERDAFLDGPIRVEEKVDGANLGLSVTPEGTVRVQNRGAYVESGAHPQFAPLWAWLAPRRDALVEALGTDLVLFGEWCFAVHTVRYDRLPDWFLGFDVYEHPTRRYWSSRRRDALLDRLDIVPAPPLARGRHDLDALHQLVETSPSSFGDEPLEGIYLRREDEEWLLDRAKLVRPGFTQAIDEHWSRRALERNRLASSSPAPVA